LVLNMEGATVEWGNPGRHLLVRPVAMTISLHNLPPLFQAIPTTK